MTNLSTFPGVSPQAFVACNMKSAASDKSLGENKAISVPGQTVHD